MIAPMVIRQSDLSSFSYCAMRQRYDHGMIANNLSHKLPRLSATIYGTVLHACLEFMQRGVNEGKPDMYEQALAKFQHLWHPERIHELPGVPGWPNVWVKKTNSGMYSSFAAQTLAAAHGWMEGRIESGEVLLGTELQFDLPYEVDGVTHTLHGTIDRLSLVFGSGKTKPPMLIVGDWKTGKKPTYLQYAMQWTIYSWASTQPAFWENFRGIPAFNDVLAALYARGFSLFGESEHPLVPRRGLWLSAQDGGFSESDCGFRGDQHFARMRLAIKNYVEARVGGFAPLTMDNEKCNFCVYNGQDPLVAEDPDVPVCGDAPLPVFQEGVEPWEQWVK